MEPDAVDRLRLHLLARREALIAEGDAPVAVEETGPVASDVDEDEQPYREMGQAIASNRNRERLERLGAIDGALRRLAADPEAFGLCEDCGDEIAEKRLWSMPWARRCVDCQSEADRGRSAHTRRKVTDYR